MNRKSLKFASLVLLLVAAFTLSACGKEEEQTKEEIKKQVKVQNIAIQEEIDSNLVLSSTVVPQEYSMIKSLVSGTVEYLAPVGSQVSVGQPLFSIRNQGIEDNYFNALQSFNQTQSTTAQRTKQAELALNSAKARLDLARVQYDNSLFQANQSLKNTKDSAVLAYNSAYNTLSQLYLFLNKNLDLDDKEYIYNNLLTPQVNLKSSNNLKFNTALDYFNGVSSSVTPDTVESHMASLQQSLELSKTLVDDTVILLQNAVSGGVFSEARIESDKGTMTTYQASINSHLSQTIASINAVSNTKVSNTLSVNNAQAQLNLAEIEYNNSEVALDNARDGAILESTMSQSQLDSAAYQYNNLRLASPFSGTVLSHFVNAGEQISLGQELIEVGNLSIVEISVDVDVSFAKAIKLGDQVMIDNQYKGIVTEVDPIGDLQSGKVNVTVQSQEAGENLVAGSTAEVKFSLKYQDVNSIVVPLNSVTVEASGNYVFVVDSENKVLRKNVQLGNTYGDKVAILGGLEEGDRLILLNGVFVSVGDEVEIVE